MFSKSLARAANRTCTAVGSSSSSTVRTTQCLAARQQQQGRPQQRRHSSSNSKASTGAPSDSTSSAKPEPAAEPATAEEKAAAGWQEPTSQHRSTNKRTSRPKRSRQTVSPDKQQDQFAGLPAVPGTQHLSYSDFSVSSFFSLHRPLSIATTIPQPAESKDFDKIFETRKRRDPWANGNSAEGRPEDVVYALRDIFENIGTTSNDAQDEGVRWEVMAESSDGVKHLDGPPRMKTLDEMVAQFKPFEPPPPPQPFLEDMRTAEKKKKASKPKQKRYATTIFLTESTSANGQTTYTASTSPIVQIPEEQVSMEEPTFVHERNTFRERMQQRQRAYLTRQQEKKATRPGMYKPFIRKAPSAARMNRMLLISVKRQRKLKMKKHKYKKLMKRTRNLRRRQDRA